MDFKKYDSIDNIHREKTIKYIRQNKMLLIVSWVATLKIHGTNFAIYYNKNGDMRFASRNRFLNSEEDFFGYKNIDFLYIPALFDTIVGTYMHEEVNDIIVYCELFGGIYPHKDVIGNKNAVRVQSDVYYTPDNDIRIFDIRVNGIYQHWDYVKSVVKTSTNYKTVPEIKRGMFEDVISLDPVFQDPLHKEYCLPSLKNNEAEGYVIKPTGLYYFGNGSRVILKSKNPKFSERCKKKKGVKKIQLSESMRKVYDILYEYITENRLRNVLSHGDLEKISDKDFGKILGLFCKDIFDDFYKDNSYIYDDLDKREQKNIKKMMSKQAANIIRENFLNIIDGVF